MMKKNNFLNLFHGFIPKVGVPIFKSSDVNLGGILFGKILGLN